jgi:probable HAF family extracellular repeat protein
MIKLCTIGLALWLACTVAQAVEYQLTDLGPVKANAASRAMALNDSGDAVGDAIRDLNVYQAQASLFRHGRVVNLMRRSGTPSRVSVATQINRHGVIVGSLQTDSHTAWLPFVDDHGSTTVLEPLSSQGYATGVNEHGVIVGVFLTDEGDCQCGFRYANGQWTALRSPVGGQDAAALAINDAGLIVGWANDRAGRKGQPRAVVWRDGQAHALPDLGGHFSEARAVNRQGDIVGVSRLSDGIFDHAVLYRDGKVIDLDGSANSVSEAHAINPAGHIVGRRHNETQNGAFLVQDGQMQALDDLLTPSQQGLWSVLDATGINASGQIVGTARRSDRAGDRAVLLVPVSR